jgi:hypothetical protein
MYLISDGFMLRTVGSKLITVGEVRTGRIVDRFLAVLDDKRATIVHLTPLIILFLSALESGVVTVRYHIQASCWQRQLSS